MNRQELQQKLESMTQEEFDEAVERINIEMHIFESTIQPVVQQAVERGMHPMAIATAGVGLALRMTALMEVTIGSDGGSDWINAVKQMVDDLAPRVQEAINVASKAKQQAEQATNQERT